MLETNRFVLLNVDTIDGLQLSLLHGLAWPQSATKTKVKFDGLKLSHTNHSSVWPRIKHFLKSMKAQMEFLQNPHG